MKLPKINDIMKFAHLLFGVYLYVYVFIFLFKGLFVDLYYIFNCFAYVFLLIINDFLRRKYENT